VSLNLLASDKESYEQHAQTCVKEWMKIKNRAIQSLQRIFETENGDGLQKVILAMVLHHDVGKLSRRWQQQITLQKEKAGFISKKINHSILGGVYTYHLVAENLNENLQIGKVAFEAILIHHSGLSISTPMHEDPEGMLFRDGLVKGERILWNDGADTLLEQLNGKYGFEHYPLDMISFSSVKTASDISKAWLWCGGIREKQHKVRICTSTLYHILKLCDLRAAWISRKDERDLRLIERLTLGVALEE